MSVNKGVTRGADHEYLISKSVYDGAAASVHLTYSIYIIFGMSVTENRTGFYESGQVHVSSCFIAKLETVLMGD